MTDRIKILLLSANPVDTSRIRLDQEVREIDEMINSARQGDRFELIKHPATRTTDLQKALLRYKPHIVHFGGHGSANEGIVLEDSAGRRKPLSLELLAELFELIPDNVRIVVMNACYSRLQADSISKFIDFTIGMTSEIGDQSAILFSSSFYLALAYGRSVKEAFGLGVLAIKQEGIAEGHIPSLLIKDGVDASKAYILSLQPKDAERSNPTGEREGPPGTPHSSFNGEASVVDTTINAGGGVTIGGIIR